MVALLALAPAPAAAAGRVHGRVREAATGEPVTFADVALVPVDSTRRPVGGLTDSLGAFVLEAPAGTYSLQVRAMSYMRRVIPGVNVSEGGTTPLEVTLATQAILQHEVVVEAKAKTDNESALLAARKRDITVGDAVSAQQVRKSADRDAAEVLRRVTGLSVNDGKYVFVRGMGERYSSTELDGVRLSSPEANKRVVPLDLVPANLIDHVQVQKTYSADRPGEFGGGDVQVHTQDFPTARTWSFSAAAGLEEGTTFREFGTYRSSRADVFGFGAASRALPGPVVDMAGGKPVTTRGLDPHVGFTADSLADIGASFKNVWSPNAVKALPAGSYAATYGDRFRPFGRALGVVMSGNLSRSYHRQQERQRFFNTLTDTAYDYAVDRSVERVQLGGMGAVSAQLSPRNSVHLRGVYSHDADDEVRVYQGYDHADEDSYTGEAQFKRGTRLQYVERSMLATSLQGRHDLAWLARSKLDWKVSGSWAKRDQPDQRSTVYERASYRDDDDNLHTFWRLTGPTREFGDLDEQGWGADGSWGLPYRLGALGQGQLEVGAAFQTKQRDSFYRRFQFDAPRSGDPAAPAESLFQERYWNGTVSGAQLTETTRSYDNYAADQTLSAGFVSLAIPGGSRVRTVLGVRMEHGFQEVRSFDLFVPNRIVALGRLDHVDWLPSANVSIALNDATQLRMAGSRTLSRPDLTEMSPRPSLEYEGGFLVAGNPDLDRALIDNYDLRVERYAGGANLVALGAFYKRLHQPIERVIRGGDAPVLVPMNSESGRNVGLELELRTSPGRLWRALDRLFINTNASWISSEVTLKPQLTTLGSSQHPLQGQANYLVNATLGYLLPQPRAEVTLLINSVGKRLADLGLYTRPDIYEQPVTTLDATLAWTGASHVRLKLAAKNLLDAQYVRLQGPLEYSSYHPGRSFSLGLSFGS